MRTNGFPYLNIRSRQCPRPKAPREEHMAVKIQMNALRSASYSGMHSTRGSFTAITSEYLAHKQENLEVHTSIREQRGQHIKRGK